jgi:hypothetical protein
MRILAGKDKSAEAQLLMTYAAEREMPRGARLESTGR